MEYNSQVFGGLCSTAVFTVNGIPADSADFGVQGDSAPDGLYTGCCGDMRFERRPPAPEALARYRISREDYEVIAAELERELSFGRCGMCE